jgi:hypothetical protein
MKAFVWFVFYRRRNLGGGSTRERKYLSLLPQNRFLANKKQKYFLDDYFGGVKMENKIGKPALYGT